MNVDKYDEFDLRGIVIHCFNILTYLTECIWKTNDKYFIFYYIYDIVQRDFLVIVNYISKGTISESDNGTHPSVN